MRLVKVTMDGFESTDTRQQFRKRKFIVDYLSMDKDKLPYEDLREAIYEDRIEWPTYVTYLFPGSAERVNILQQELLGLTDTGRKIDHPKDGSKDLADAVAGVVCTLMGDKQYRKGLSSRRDSEREDQATSHKTMDDLLKEFDRSPATPFGDILSPSGMPSATGLGIQIPDRLLSPKMKGSS